MPTFSRPVKKRKFPVVGETRDTNNIHWYVRDIRTTKHGFDLLFGSPVLSRPKNGLYSGQLPQLIATQPLMDFWDVNRTKHDGFLFDLPAGRTTLKRLRARMGFNFTNDWSDWWDERRADLETLSVSAFAKKHGIKKNVAFEKRFKIFGRRARQIGWWRTPEHLEILRRTPTLHEIAGILNISVSQAFRLRAKALDLLSQE